MASLKQISRRHVLQLSVGALGSAAMGTITGPGAFAKAFNTAVCRLTPPQTEGPFYPVHDQLDKDNDLTQIRGQMGKAEGQVIYIMGEVKDLECKPIPDALVEIWQACRTGKYNHPDDKDNPAPLDPNFQYWGQELTDAKGRYIFKTIIPGRYLAAPNWMRPPHIHYKVTAHGYTELTTQMYFVGDKDNAGDQILNAIPVAERASVLVELEDPTPDLEPTSKLCQFDLTLRRG